MLVALSASHPFPGICRNTPRRLVNKGRDRVQGSITSLGCMARWSNRHCDAEG